MGGIIHIHQFFGFEFFPIPHAPVNSDIGRHLRGTRDAPAMMHDKFDIGVLFGQL